MPKPFVLLFAAIFGTVLALGFPEAASAQFDYQQMENLPGFENDDIADFPTYVVDLYRLGIWIVGLSAMLMIVIGGFMYMSSAGNTSRISTAKTIIWDAIIGLVIALTAWLMLNVINQDLRDLRLDNVQFQRPQFNITVSGAGTAPASGSGNVVQQQNQAAINAAGGTTTAVADPGSNFNTTLGWIDQFNLDRAQLVQQCSTGGALNYAMCAGNVFSAAASGTMTGLSIVGESAGNAAGWLVNCSFGRC